MTVWTVGDSEPSLSGTCTDDGDPVALDAATAVAVHIRRPDGTTLVRAPTLDPDQTGAGKGRWSLVWQNGDLAVRGAYAVEVEVTWPGDRVQTFAARDALFEVRDQYA